MKLVISEYLRTLKERDELDRLLPDLLVEMGYVPIARPQTGNRQFGVDLALRGMNLKTNLEELLLLVVKQGDIGRQEWDGNVQGVRSSINEILDVYLKSCVEPQDTGKPVRIVLATNGELKQTIQASWSGYVTDHEARANIEFWGTDCLSELVEEHLLNEHVFRDEDRKNLRRALALSGDSEYDRRDFHKLLLRALDLTDQGGLADQPKTGKALIKALRIVNFAAHTFAAWAITDGDARQGLKGMERALLWSWHRIQLADEKDRNAAIADAFSSMWLGYLNISRQYFDRLQQHCFVEDGLFGYYSDGSEFSLVAFEQIGSLSTIGLSQVFFSSQDPGITEAYRQNADVVADAVAALIRNNPICNSPCFDRHSQDITLAMTLLLTTNRIDEAKAWLRRLVRNVDYAFKAKRYVPISSDSLDDLADAGGWHTGQTEDRLLTTSWMLATLAGWSALSGLDECYAVIRKGSLDLYAETCMQLWHPDADIYKHIYFKPAHYECGASEAPIKLPATANEWREHMRVIVKSQQNEIASKSMASQAGIPALELIACRHFSTPLAPYFWYRFASIMFPDETAVSTDVADPAPLVS